MNIDFQLPVTRYHKVLNVLSIAMIVGVFVFLLLSWKHIPDQVPGHYNGVGEIDRWGSKAELWMCPVFSVIIYLIITFTERHPRIWNTGVKVTVENQARVYCTLKNMIVTLKFAVVFLLEFITIHSVTAKPLPVWFLPATMILVFGPMAYYMFILYVKK